MKTDAYTVTLTLSEEQTKALLQALETHLRLSLGQLEYLVELHREDVIPLAQCYRSPEKAPEDLAYILENVMGAAKKVLGFHPGSSYSIHSSVVHVNGKRNFEVYKVLRQALAFHAEPNPPLDQRGVYYDGLSIRCTEDPVPTVKIRPISSEGGS